MKKKVMMDGWIKHTYEREYTSKIIDLFNHIKVIDLSTLEGKVVKNIILEDSCEGNYIKNLNYINNDLVYEYAFDSNGKSNLTSSEKKSN